MVGKKQASLSKAVYTEIPPNPKRFIAALREMGYTSVDALMDLIDNSIDARATRIDVSVRAPQTKQGSIIIDILDNGIGMDKATLNQALRFGSDTEHDASVDLGKYGMGLNSAGLSLARTIWVMTRQDKAVSYEATFDLDHIERANKFEIVLHECTRKDVFDILGDHGTLVRLSQIDRISDTNVQRFSTGLKDQIGETYHHLIEGGLTIMVNGRKVAARDPLMRKHPLTKVVLDTDIEWRVGKKVHVTAVQLPELGQDEDASSDIRPANSGIYVFRNRRQIMGAQTFGYYRHHHNYSHFRAELSFDGTLDNDFHVDIKKGTIQPDHRLLEAVGLKLRTVITETARYGQDRDVVPKLSHSVGEDRLAALFTAPARNHKADKKETGDAPARTISIAQERMDSPRLFKATDKDGQTTLTYNTAHPFFKHVAKQPGSMPVLDMVAGVLAKVESENPDSSKVIKRVSELLQDIFAKSS